MTRRFIATSLVMVLAGLVALSVGCCEIPDPAPPQTDCGDDDPRVGQSGEFNNHVHGIAGTARIVDNCTIVVDDFYYDGIGIDVRFIGVVDGDFMNGTILTDDIRRVGGYKGETFTITLPEGVTLDDVPVLSVNCVGSCVNFSFGEAVFQ